MKTQDTLSTYEFHEMFPDEETAVAWFESTRWPDGRHCPHCGSTNTVECAKPQPYRCRDCRKHFSARTGTVMQASKLPVKKWLYAMYLISVSKKGLSSLQLARELGIAQEAAWRLGHKIREAWNQDALFPMAGEVEVDETYVGGKEKNKHRDKKLNAGRGAVGKQPVMGLRQRGTGDVHESVAHSAGEYVRDQVHTNGIESFWALLKRGLLGSYHHVSVKHLSRYVDEFCHRHNARDEHALAFMRRTASEMVGRRLTHRMLVDGEAA